MTGPTVLFEDNTACINMVKNAKGWKHTKHIDVRLHFVRDLAEQGILDIEYVPTWKQVADAMTKALPLKDFLKFRDLLLGQKDTPEVLPPQSKM